MVATTGSPSVRPAATIPSASDRPRARRNVRRSPEPDGVSGDEELVDGVVPVAARAAARPAGSPCSVPA